MNIWNKGSHDILEAWENYSVAKPTNSYFIVPLNVSANQITRKQRSSIYWGYDKAGWKLWIKSTGQLINQSQILHTIAVTTIMLQRLGLITQYLITRHSNHVTKYSTGNTSVPYSADQTACTCITRGMPCMCFFCLLISTFPVISGWCHNDVILDSRTL
jgi:hypothetical protein